MRFAGLVGAAYSLDFVQYDCQTLKNAILEAHIIGNGRNAEPAYMRTRPGVLELFDTGEALSRGGIRSGNGNVYWVFGSKLVQVNIGAADGTGWSYNVLTPYLVGGSAPVAFADAGDRLFMVVGNTVQVYTYTTGVLTTPTGGAWTTASDCAFINARVVFTKQNSTQFYWTDLPTGTTDISSLTADVNNFANTEGTSDRNVGINNLANELWIFKRDNIETWFDRGDPVVNFGRAKVGITTGCHSRATVKQVNQTLVWLARDVNGGPFVAVANGYTPARVSTLPLERQWQGLSAAQLQGSTADLMDIYGHRLYLLSFPDHNATYVYDVTTSNMIGNPVWYVWTSAVGGVETRFKGQGHVSINGLHIVGGFDDGKLYLVTDDAFDDNGENIFFERAAPHMSAGQNRVAYNGLRIDCGTGNTTSQTLDPKVFLDWSDDGGYTWSEPREGSFGKVGEYSKLLEYYKLGSAENRVFRIRCTEAARLFVSGADINVKIGR